MGIQGTVKSTNKLRGEVSLPFENFVRAGDIIDIAHGGTGATSVEGARNELQVAQAISSEEDSDCYYRDAGNELEWINPPMYAGVEYRTTERWEGYPVYTKLLRTSALSGSTNLQYFADATVTPIDLRGYLYRNGITAELFYPIPTISSLMDNGLDVTAHAQDNQILIKLSGSAVGVYTAEFVIKYVKYRRNV